MVPLNIPELVSRETFLILVRLPGGAATIFAQSWNFELKFLVGIQLMQKITSTSVGSQFLSQKCLEGPETQLQKLNLCLDSRIYVFLLSK